jgi:hypothetical protein
MGFCEPENCPIISKYHAEFVINDFFSRRLDALQWGSRTPTPIMKLSPNALLKTSPMSIPLADLAIFPATPR